MESILKVSDLNKSYGNFSLSNVSFSLPEGCITGFIGVNGAGKTTTLRTILELTNRTSGHIEFFGLDMQSHEQKIKNRIGVVLDDGYFYEELSLAEMKSIIAPAYTSWCEQDFKNYLERFNLNPKQKINTLSKGMKMKYALALALSHKAELLIMDEPTSGLDPLIRSQLLTILTDYMNSGGKGVFFSTHITSDLDKIADMLIMIDNGHIVFQEEKDTLLDYYRIVKGDVRYLNAETRKLFLSTTETAFGFSGVTKKISEVQRLIPDVVVERPTIEDIMLGSIEGGKNNANPSSWKRFSYREEVCFAYVSGLCVYTAVYDVANRRRNLCWFYELYLSCNFFCFYAIAVCFIEGEPIRKSVYTTLCYTISPQTTCTF